MWQRENGTFSSSSKKFFDSILMLSFSCEIGSTFHTFIGCTVGYCPPDLSFYFTFVVVTKQVYCTITNKWQFGVNAILCNSDAKCTRKTKTNV